MGERVLVLGGGVIGLATAFELSQRGYAVTILEKTVCGGQASGAAAGMLAPFSEIGEDPDDFFQLCLDSLRMYKKWQQEVKRVSKLDFEYSESGSLHAVYHEADVLALETRKSWQEQWGTEAELLTGEQLRKMEPLLSKDLKAAMYYPEESHVFAPDYVLALEQACRENGVTISDRLESVEILEWKEAVHLRSKSGKDFRAEQLIICSGAWASELEHVFHIRIPVYPIRGQICAYDMQENDVNHIIYTSQGYFVPKANGTLVNGASEDIAGFQTSVTEKGIERLTNWNKRVFPHLTQKNPFHTWAGLRPATQDGFPLIGKLQEAEHITFATGHYRNGILLSPITAVAVADLLDGRKSIYSPLQSCIPERFS
ncbi:glycine oxidase ThiO [Halalkalibacter sp. APA_J-10(15)]|uniref:glycine oxidase ThiO n=1 Tax=unclassified Halalkalibacter TaxID=2893063 RepID=UPI001FF4B3D8|nr:glycine oxidase ThiO [Halalkalibacter sp. APA_J-10(15)]MCK0471501.1 glycine oxidase ThiO [Halalkalibacter sp. APA_J-10(15)]